MIGMMYTSILAVAPGLFWMYYIYKKDNLEKEPLSKLFTVFVKGLLITIPAGFVNSAVFYSLGSLIATVICAPIVEESLKYFVLKKHVLNSPEFNEPIDGIIYSSMVALGFATLENVQYVIDAMVENQSLQVGIMRAILSVPGHMLFTGIIGYGMSVYKFKGKGRPYQGVIFAIIGHSVFNFLAFNGRIGYVFILVIILWVIFLFNISRLKKWRREVF